MRLFAVHRSPLGIVLSLAVSCSPAFGLVSLDDGHHQFFIQSSAGLAYDSNIFATADGAGDTSYNASLEIEYQRKVGLIGVDANLDWHFSRFSKFTGENFANPDLTAEFTKGSGRTTGSLKLDVKRESRAETEINLRTTSWNYNADLQVKYPVIERYSIVSELAYARRDFPSNNDGLFDLVTYAFNTDLFYALNSQRNLLVGYRFRSTETSADTTDTDHGLNIGLNGKILPKINGSARVGFQRRGIQRRGQPDESHDSVSANVAATWTLTSRWNVVGSLARDFTTVATDASVNTTSAGLTSQFAFNAKTVVYAGITYSHSNFLDTRLAGRRDDSASFDAGVSYALNAHFKLSVGYVYFVNWSTLATSDYDRHSFSINVSSRW